MLITKQKYRTDMQKKRAKFKCNIYLKSSSNQRKRTTAKKNKNEIQKHYRTGNKMQVIPVNNLNVNGLNTIIKNQIMAKWIKIRKTHECCLQEIHFISKETHILTLKK